MDKTEGYAYALENGLVDESSGGNFYKLFKSIARLDNLTSTEKIIFTIIMSYTSKKLEFYMSNECLGEETGMNSASIFRAIKSLRLKKYIKTYYKVKDGKTIGRIVKPIADTIHKGLEQSWGNIEYIEYGNDISEDSEEQEEKEIF